MLTKFFSQTYREIPRTPLMKFIYVADVLSREYLGHPISTFDYRRDKYGPYDDAIEEAVAEVVALGLAEHEKEPRYSGLRGGASERLTDLGRPAAFDFTLGEVAVLGYVVKNYLDLPFREFLHDVVYETVPMKAQTARGQRLQMQAVDNQGTKRVGFNIEEVLAAEESARRGEVITLSAFVDELHSQAPA